MHRLRGRRSALLLVASLVLAPAMAQSASAPTAAAVKAAFLYKFGNYVEWPNTVFRKPDDPLVVGVMGDDAVLANLEQLVTGRLAGSHPVRVRRVRDDEPIDGVHILYVAPASEAKVREALRRARGPVLPVTDLPGGLELGAAVNFLFDDGKVRFEASQRAAEQRGLRLSSRLLAVAQTVEGRP
jgi:hypothetical protein